MPAESQSCILPTFHACPQRIASEELGVSEEEMDMRLGQLLVLLPGLEVCPCLERQSQTGCCRSPSASHHTILSLLCAQSRLVGAPPKLIARLAAQTSEVALRVLQLKDCFPNADVSAMLNNRLTLLLDDDIEEVRDAGRKLRSALPDIDVDR